MIRIDKNDNTINFSYHFTVDPTVPMAFCRNLRASAYDGVRENCELRHIFNNVFENCKPNSNDEVELSLLLENLMNIAGDDQAYVLKLELFNVFGNREGSMIGRNDFLKSLMTKKYEVDLSSPTSLANSLSPVEKFSNYHRKSSSSEADEQEHNFERLNRHLIKSGIMKDQILSKLEKENEDLKRAICTSVVDEEGMKSYYGKKIEELKEQLKEAKENYLACSKKLDTLDDVEHELHESNQQNKYLKVQIDTMKKDHRAAQDRIVSLESKVNELLLENHRLSDAVEENKMLYLELEELRNEKKELKETLFSVSVSKIAHFEGISEDEISPDRVLPPIPARDPSMSLAEELELCHQDIDKYPTSCLCRELSLEDRSTSCSELVPELIEQAVQTEEVNISIRRRLTNMGMQTDLVNRKEAFTQTDMFVMPPKSSRCCCSQTQTDELQVSQRIWQFVMAVFWYLSSILSRFSKFFSTLGDIFFTILSVPIVFTYILLFFAVIFIFILLFFALLTYNELLSFNFPDWVASVIRDSIKIRYTRGMPPC
ncbi:hypothetical protein GE061_012866 [Apolygus lucorum]|uniref:Uncharacterized protein n=1 Tax=Apolygus lucorum TaxID=248454 RepID=A0A8S9XUR1_APOLU|nr:hypothetical protein GE061_012866 [Apolygus lucorum]